VLRTFNATIPFGKIIGNIPVVFLIGTLPITPGGLGTTNAATVELFAPYISSPAISAGLINAGELIFAATLLWMFVNYTMKVIVGTILWSTQAKSLFKGKESQGLESEIPKIHESF
jgi:uncharacterized membrane protein YbhN (UPF0104 family)